MLDPKLVTAKSLKETKLKYSYYHIGNQPESLKGCQIGVNTHKLLGSWCKCIMYKNGLSLHDRTGVVQIVAISLQRSKCLRCDWAAIKYCRTNGVICFSCQLDRNLSSMILWLEDKHCF